MLSQLVPRGLLNKGESGGRHCSWHSPSPSLRQQQNKDGQPPRSWIVCFMMLQPSPQRPFQPWWLWHTGTPAGAGLGSLTCNARASLGSAGTALGLLFSWRMGRDISQGMGRDENLCGRGADSTALAAGSFPPLSNCRKTARITKRKSSLELFSVGHLVQTHFSLSK